MTGGRSALEDRTALLTTGASSETAASKERHAAVIIGAGPSGAAAAIRLAQRGACDVVLLDKDVFPREKTCGSAISPSGVRLLDELGVGAQARLLGTPVHALKLVTPGNRAVWLTNGDGVICPRRDLDHLLVSQARRLGVDVREGWRASELIEEAGRVIGVRGSGGEIRGSQVLVADGAHSVFSRDPRPRRTIWTLMGWWEGGDFAPGTIEMVFDRSLSPLYGWMFPESGDRVSIGVCIDAEAPGARRSERGLRDLFDRFVATHYRARLGGARQVGKLKGHPISHTTWIGHSAAPGVLYLGEAARMTHNLTGEGIHQALESGLHAADAVSSIVRGERSEQRAHRAYTWQCRRRFTLSFGAGHLLRGALRTPLCEGLASAYNGLIARRMAAWSADAALAAASAKPA